MYFASEVVQGQGSRPQLKILLVFPLRKELTAAASSIKSRFQCRKQERATQRFFLRVPLFYLMAGPYGCKEDWESGFYCLPGSWEVGKVSEWL